MAALDDLVATVREVWKKEQGVETLAIVWCGEGVTLDNGTPSSGCCLASLESFAPQARRAALVKLVERTKAFALLLVEQRAKEAVTLYFESHHGARSWTLPIVRHGDLLVLGEATIRDDVDHLGILWSSRRGKA